MKKLIEKYVFDPAQKNVVFNDYENIELERVLLITNVTKNIIIYNFANPLAGAQVLNNNILHLQYDTSTMSNTDKLQIFYEEDTLAATEVTQENLFDLMYLVFSSLKDLSSILTTIQSGSVRTLVVNSPNVNAAVTSIGGAQAHTMATTLHNLVFQNIIDNIKEV